jgi:hypothetical protein
LAAASLLLQAGKNGLTSSGAWLNGLAPLPPPVAPVAASLLSPLRMPARRITAEAPPALEAEVAECDTVDHDRDEGAMHASTDGVAMEGAKPDANASKVAPAPAAARPLSLSFTERKVPASTSQPASKASSVSASGPAAVRKPMAITGAGARPGPSKVSASGSAHHAGAEKVGMPQSRAAGPAASHGSTTGGVGTHSATASGQRSGVLGAGPHKPRSTGPQPGDTAAAAKPASTSGAPAIKPLMLKGITAGTGSKSGSVAGAPHAARSGSLSSRAGSSSTLSAAPGVMPRGAVTARPGGSSHSVGTAAAGTKHGYSGSGHSGVASAGPAGPRPGVHKQVQGGVTAATAGAVAGKVAGQQPAVARNLNDVRLEEVIKARFCLKPGGVGNACLHGDLTHAWGSHLYGCNRVSPAGSDALST